MPLWNEVHGGKIPPKNQWALNLFIFLFLFRYVRLVVHLAAFLAYRPTPVPENPTYEPEDATVIIPSVEPYGHEFEECIRSVLANKAGEIIVVTVGKERLALAKEVCSRLSRCIRVLSTDAANKRVQVVHGLRHSRKAEGITVLLDDHVFWPNGFLPHLLAPFEDPEVGMVGTCKRVRRFNLGFSTRDFWNFIGCLYLERHNFEITATNYIDGGVFVISGRTSAARSAILLDQNFMRGFANERFFFNKCGPLNADDDNFITRWMVTHGWKLRIQNSPEARIVTTLGTYPKFISQCLRWARTTPRSNAASLITDRTVWRAQPWCVYAVYITMFVNYALLYDAAMLYILWISPLGTPTAMAYLGLWIFCSKLVKPFPHFWRRPEDLIWLPGYILFGYFHSFIKLYATLTFWVTAWGSRGKDVK